MSPVALQWPWQWMALKCDLYLCVPFPNVFYGLFTPLMLKRKTKHLGNVPSSVLAQDLGFGVCSRLIYFYSFFHLHESDKINEAQDCRTQGRFFFPSGFNTVHVGRFITHCSRLSPPPFSAASYCSSAHVEPMSNRIIWGWLVCAPVSVVRPMRLKMATQKYANCSAFSKKDKRRKPVEGGLASWRFSKTLVALAQILWDDMDFHPSVWRQTGCESTADREF